MTIRNLAIASAGLAFLFGLPALLVPAQFVAPFGVELSEAGLLATRLFGGHLLALALVDWYARDDLRGGGRPGAERGIVLANILAPALSVIILLIGILGGLVNALAWANVALLALFGIGWAYLGLLGRGTAGAAA